jgi:hypothetical protein
LLEGKRANIGDFRLQFLETLIAFSGGENWAIIASLIVRRLYEGLW